MPVRRLAGPLALLFVLAGLSGCASTTGPPAFDGAKALEFVKAFALNPDGSVRYRIPSTVGQQTGASMLWRSSDLAGWTRTFQNFTGRDYMALDRSVVRGYTEASPYNGCTKADHDAVANLTFANLLVTRPGPAGAPTLMLAAHWDSQMHSDNDPDPSKRDLPDPGANDGASGVGLLLQLMRHLDGMELPFTVTVFFVDGEDGFYDCYPDAGSLYDAQHPIGALPDAFILLDMVGDPGALYPKETHSRFGPPSGAVLQDLVWGHAQRLPGGAAHFRNSTRTIEDDHLAFLDVGVPSLDIVDAGGPATFPAQWDTTFDTVDKLSASMLALVGDALLGTLADPAFSAWLAAPPSV